MQSTQFDPFDELLRPGSLRVVIHNVKLIGVQQDDSGNEKMIVEYDDTTHELMGSGPWNEERSRQDVGKMGYIAPATPIGQDLPVGACHFRAYIDQSLRRIPELDSSAVANSEEGREPCVIGWRCDARASGFRAPVGIIPGESGRFVPDKTVLVTLRVPPEFERVCHQVQMTAEELLRSFVGDLAGIRNLISVPRADRYGSNGSDERDYAEAWLDRAHGMNRIDLDALEAQEEERRERQLLIDDLVDLLDDFEHYGGSLEDLMNTVQAFVQSKMELAGQQGNES